jgi:hypothetical protein
MADIKHAPSASPVEGDGVNYGGIGWFIVVLVGTTLACQVLVWGLFKVMAWRSDKAEPQRTMLAAPQGSRSLENGRMVTGAEKQPAVPLLVGEPTVLREFRGSEDAQLKTYGWVDKGAQTVRLPIDRAKDLLLERGLPIRAAAPDTPATSKPAAETTKK